ncbi:uncharacterized protein M8220_003898 [Acridotheres tristis]
MWRLGPRSQGDGGGARRWVGPERQAGLGGCRSPSWTAERVSHRSLWTPPVERSLPAQKAPGPWTPPSLTLPGDRRHRCGTALPGRSHPSLTDVESHPPESSRLCSVQMICMYAWNLLLKASKTLVETYLDKQENVCNPKLGQSIWA